MTARTLDFPRLQPVRLPRPPQAWRRALAFVGPGYLVAVGYMDPGNWAVDIAGGAAARYGLLVVVLAASLAAMFVQDLVVRLTVATGRDLASLMRERLPRPLSLAVWLASEVAIIATELAELLGGAIAFKLLLGTPLIVGAAATAAITLLLMIGPVAGKGRIEGIIGVLVAAIALGVGAELLLVRPDLDAVLRGFLPDPALLGNPQRLYLALGILGATVMPHNLYLHSGLVRDRLRAVAPHDRALAGRVAGLDSAVALTLAFLVNAAILIVAGAVLPDVAGAEVGLEAAPQLIAGAVGSGLAAILFALALLAAGQSSTITGALAGQLVMQGFLRRRLPTWLRLLGQRGAALGLAFVLLTSGGEGAGDRLLVLSQVVLSLTLPAVLLPLAWLTRGIGVGPLRRAGAWAFALILTGLNLYLLPGLLGA
ncbi:MAG: Nramp family divalent metal transporter [Pseudomonadota bacterium]